MGGSMPMYLTIDFECESQPCRAMGSGPKRKSEQIAVSPQSYDLVAALKTIPNGWQRANGVLRCDVCARGETKL